MSSRSTALISYTHKTPMEFIKSEVERILLSNKSMTIKQISIPVDPQLLKKIINILEGVAAIDAAIDKPSKFIRPLEYPVELEMMEVRKTNTEYTRHRGALHFGVLPRFNDYK